MINLKLLAVAPFVSLSVFSLAIACFFCRRRSSRSYQIKNCAIFVQKFKNILYNTFIYYTISYI